MYVKAEYPPLDGGRAKARITANAAIAFKSKPGITKECVELTSHDQAVKRGLCLNCFVCSNESNAFLPLSKIRDSAGKFL